MASNSKTSDDQIQTGDQQPEEQKSNGKCLVTRHMEIIVLCT